MHVHVKEYVIPKSCALFRVCEVFKFNPKSEYDQEIPQSHTADQSMAP